MKPDAAIAYPAGSSLVTQEWAASVRNLVVERARFGNLVLSRRGVLLFLNRNNLTKAFLETNRTWLLMTDVDIVFTPEDVDALFASAEERGPGVYSGVVMSLGHRGIKPIFGDWVPEAQKAKFRDVPPKRSDPDELMSVVPTAFLLVHREVFEAIGTEWFDHLRSIDGENRILGEDLAFCLRTINAGFPITLVSQARPGHVKTGVFYPDSKDSEE